MNDLFDAHFHYAVCVERRIFDIDSSIQMDNWTGLSCAHSPEEWNIQDNGPKNIFRSFGIHPQVVGNVDLDYYKDFLKQLAISGKLNAIGEAGFDFFTDEFKATRELQEDVWNYQVNLAIKFSLPLVVHCRKGNDLLFRYSSMLKKIPVVLFHSFMGSFVEASSLIKRGINCFFSFGKQIFNNNKKVIDCVKNIPLENLLFETDGPFQTLKGEENTYPSDILKVYEGAYKLRVEKGENISYSDFCKKIMENKVRLISDI